jgi:hypothetical protein
VYPTGLVKWRNSDKGLFKFFGHEGLFDNQRK